MTTSAYLRLLIATTACTVIVVLVAAMVLRAGGVA